MRNLNKLMKSAKLFKKNQMFKAVKWTLSTAAGGSVLGTASLACSVNQ